MIRAKSNNIIINLLKNPQKVINHSFKLEDGVGTDFDDELIHNKIKNQFTKLEKISLKLGENQGNSSSYAYVENKSIPKFYLNPIFVNNLKVLTFEGKDLYFLKEFDLELNEHESNKAISEISKKSYKEIKKLLKDANDTYNNIKIDEDYISLNNQDESKK